LAGISKAYLSCVELGVRPALRLPVLARLAVALEVPPRDLVLLALEDYLAYGEDPRPAEVANSADAGRAGRCRACPVSLPGGMACAGECG
jgi:transcriptional regulator with XRE-family HTH domain